MSIYFRHLEKLDRQIIFRTTVQSPLIGLHLKAVTLGDGKILRLAEWTSFYIGFYENPAVDSGLQADSLTKCKMDITIVARHNRTSPLICKAINDAAIQHYRGTQRSPLKSPLLERCHLNYSILLYIVMSISKELFVGV